jgi:hypothetical protein
MKRLIASFVLAASLVACQPAPGAIHHWSEAPAEIRAEHTAEVIQSFIDAYWREVWIRTTLWNRWMAHAAEIERIRAEAAAYPPGQCGGSLPPCWVMMRESRGDIRAENPTSSASGKWQFIDSTWAGYGGYRHASWAPEKVQDDKARLLWAGGRGCSHWSAC